MCIGKAAKPNLGKTQENREKKKKMGGGGGGGDMHWQTNLTSFCFLQVKLYPPVQKQPTSRYAAISVLSQSGVIQQVKCTACVFSLSIESV